MLHLGKSGAMKRQQWLYVNLESTGTGYEVVSPQQEKLGSLNGKIKIHYLSLSSLSISHVDCASY